jgi:ribosomal protein S18 acetylase RimI-like enzyme
MAEYDYPDEVAGPFETPPIEFTDRESREIEVRVYGDDHFEALVEMYDTFDPADRAQGLPPARESRIRGWLDTILGEGQDVVALEGDRVVGHATLVPDEDGETVELAIFVHHDYQSAGIGSKLIRGLLGHGQREGVEKVWLTVERWNHAGIALYESVGFETSSAENFELEMTLRLN